MENDMTQGTYHQMTISEWVVMKQEIQKELNCVATSFVRIGYMLRRIRDERMYEADGYGSVVEFAEKEYGIGSSTVSRFMAINERYSIDGYSERIKPEYIGYGQSKLSEMLALTDADMEMVSPEMQRQDIRELKDFIRRGGAEGVADDIYEFFEGFMKENRDMVDELYAGGTCAAADAMKEIVAPSGSRVYRKGLFFAAMGEDIKVRKAGGVPEAMTWGQLRNITTAIFGEDAGQRAYDEHFGIAEHIGTTESDPAAVDEGDGDARKIAPAQKAPEPAETRKAEGISEAAAEPSEKSEEMPPENPEKCINTESGGNLPETDGDARKVGENDVSGEKEAIAPAQKSPETAETRNAAGFSEDDMNRPEAGKKTRKQLVQSSGELSAMDYKISIQLKALRDRIEAKEYGFASLSAMKLLDLLGKAETMVKAEQEAREGTEEEEEDNE